MKIIITGLNGTLAPKLSAVAQAAGAVVQAWDRRAVDPQDPAACRAWLDAQAPEAIAHLAMGSEDWAGLLAAWTAERGIPFLFTSTAMVFHHEPAGPHRPGDQRSAQDEYGRYKIRCEDRVRSANPAARIARIGWQIDPDARGNNMLAALDQWQAEQGRVAASERWIPACSFMADTAQALWGLLLGPAPTGPAVHLDSNARSAWSFPRLVAALKLRFARDGWRLVSNQDYVHDQRLVGHESLMPSLAERLDETGHAV